MSIPQGYECGGSSTGCPAGYYIDDTPPSDIPNIYKNKVCQDCGKGYSCAGGTDRQACPIGTYSSSLNSTSCSSCPTNHTTKSTASTSESDCAPCPAGNVLNSQKICEPCPIGSFLPNDGTSCQDCPEGHISASKGASSCTLCPAGKEANQTRSLCVNCPAGTVREAGVTEQCSPCPSGSTPNEERSECLPPCSENKQRAANGTTCVCKPGYGGSECNKCDVGTYSSGGTLDDCKPCEDYTYTDISGATKCTSCSDLSGKRYQPYMDTCFKGATSFANPPNGEMVLAIGIAGGGSDKGCNILPTGSFLADTNLAQKAQPGLGPADGSDSKTKTANGELCFGTYPSDGDVGCRMSKVNYSEYTPETATAFISSTAGFKPSEPVPIASSWSANSNELSNIYNTSRSADCGSIGGGQPGQYALLATSITDGNPHIGWNPTIPIDNNPKTIKGMPAGSTFGGKSRPAGPNWNYTDSSPTIVILDKQEKEKYYGTCGYVYPSYDNPDGNLTHQIRQCFNKDTYRNFSFGSTSLDKCSTLPNGEYGGPSYTHGWTQCVYYDYGSSMPLPTFSATGSGCSLFKDAASDAPTGSHSGVQGVLPWACGQNPKTGEVVAGTAGTWFSQPLPSDYTPTTKSFKGTYPTQ